MRDRFMFGDEKKNSYIGSIVSLIGHFAGTHYLSVLLFFTWLIDYGVKFLNGINPFPEAILRIIQKVEIGIFWFDIVVSFALVLSGAVTFIRDIRR